MNTQPPQPQHYYWLASLCFSGFIFQTLVGLRTAHFYPPETWAQPVIIWLAISAALFVGAATLLQLLNWPKQQKQSGVLLLNLGRLDESGQFFGGVALVFAVAVSYCLLQANGHPNKTGEHEMLLIAGGAMTWTYACGRLGQGLSYTWITDRGVLAFNYLLQWNAVESTRWTGRDENALCLVLRPEKTSGLLWGRTGLEYTIPISNKAAVVKVLNQYLQSSSPV